MNKQASLEFQGVYRNGNLENVLHDHLVGQRVASVQCIHPFELHRSLESGKTIIVKPSGADSSDMVITINETD